MKNKKLVSLILSLVLVISVGCVCAFSASASDEEDKKYTEDDYRLLEKYFTNYDMSKFDGFDPYEYDFNNDGVVDLKDLCDLGDNVFGVWSDRY